MSTLPNAQMNGAQVGHSNQALAFIEIGGWSLAMIVLDAMEKAAGVRILQTELNDSPGVCLKLYGSLANLQAAAETAQATAGKMQTKMIAHVIAAPATGASAAYEAPVDFNPLMEFVLPIDTGICNTCSASRAISGMRAPPPQMKTPERR